jgi:hypothetical protein
MNPVVLTALGQLLGVFVGTIGVWQTVALLAFAMGCVTYAISHLGAEWYDRRTALQHEANLVRLEQFMKELFYPLLVRLQGLPADQANTVLDIVVALLDVELTRKVVRRKR